MGNCLQSELDLDAGDGWKVEVPPKASAVAPASPEKEPAAYRSAAKEAKSLRLYGDPMCSFTMQILLALRHKGVQYECSWLQNDAKKGRLEWAARNGSAAAAAPVLQHGPRKISGGQADAILQYIDSKFPERPLVPKGELGRRAREWAAFLRDTLAPLVAQLLYDGEPSIQEELQPELDLALAKVNSALGTFHNRGVAEGFYFFGGEFTLADVLLIPVVALLDPLRHFRKLEIGSASYPALVAYEKAMGSFPVYKAARVSPESLRLYVANKLEHRAPPPLLILMLMQHRSILWHFERLVILADQLVGNLGKPLTPSKSAAKVAEPNLRKLWKGYGRLVDLMQEHAQMEERVIFPGVEQLHEGLTDVANADHARDLPLTNGIKEDLKGLLALNQGTADYSEAIIALATRLKALQLHTQEHFQEEEKEFLPVLDSPVFSGNKEEVEPFIIHCLGVMESSHAHLLPFLLMGLNPQDVYQYLMVVHRHLWDTRKSTFTRMLHVIRNSDDEFHAVKKVVREKFAGFDPFQEAAAGA